MKDLLLAVEKEIQKRSISEEDVSDILINNKDITNRRIIAGYACLDGQTKLFTKRGILHFEEIKIGDQIFSIDKKTGKLIENHVKQTFIYPYNDNLVYLSYNKCAVNPFIIAATPNHRILEYTKFKNPCSLERIIKIRNLLTYKTAGSIYDRKDPSFIPTAIQLYNSRSQLGKGTTFDFHLQMEQDNFHFNSIRLPEHPSLEALLQAAAWYITEGTLDHNGITIWQSQRVHPDNFPKIIECYSRLGLSSKIGNDCVSIASVILAQFFLQQFSKGPYDKHIPRWILDLNSRYLRVFWDALMLGGGYKDKSCICSVSKKLIEAYSEIAIKLGYTVSIGSSRTSVHVSDKKSFPIKNDRKQLVPYKGHVWCIETLSQNYQNFLAVRNGKFFFTGNSVDCIDREGQKIPVEALREAVKRFMDNIFARNLCVFHSDVQVGRILPKWTNPETGETVTTLVDESGWVVIGEVRQDVEIANKVWDEIKKGNLRSFSIAGSSKEKLQKQENGVNYEQVTSLDLYECTICEVPVNPMSKFMILWDPDKVSI